MNFSNSSALNFSYILLEFYKDIGLNEDEVCLALMIDHLISDGNEYVNSSMLSTKMNFDEHKIDLLMSSLYRRKLIDIGANSKGEPYVSLLPLQRLLYKAFEASILSKEELEANEKNDKIRKNIYQELERCLNRSLIAFEIERVDGWLSAGISEKIIIDSIKDATLKNMTTINQIDKIISRKLRDQD